MAKIRTHSGASKRLKVTGTGKLLRRITGRRHLLECKSSKTSRRKRKFKELVPGFAKKLNRTIPYGL